MVDKRNEGRRVANVRAVDGELRGRRGAEEEVDVLVRKHADPTGQDGERAISRGEHPGGELADDPLALPPALPLGLGQVDEHVGGRAPIDERYLKVHICVGNLSY